MVVLYIPLRDPFSLSLFFFFLRLLRRSGIHPRFPLRDFLHRDIFDVVYFFDGGEIGGKIGLDSGGARKERVGRFPRAGKRISCDKWRAS